MRSTARSDHWSRALRRYHTVSGSSCRYTMYDIRYYCMCRGIYQRMSNCSLSCPPPSRSDFQQFLVLCIMSLFDANVSSPDSVTVADVYKHWTYLFQTHPLQIYLQNCSVENKSLIWLSNRYSDDNSVNNDHETSASGSLTWADSSQLIVPNTEVNNDNIWLFTHLVWVSVQKNCAILLF